MPQLVAPMLKYTAKPIYFVSVRCYELADGLTQSVNQALDQLA